MTTVLTDFLKNYYELLLNHSRQRRNTSTQEQQKISTAIIHCQLDLLKLLNNELTSLERVAIFTAQEYWVNEALELTPIMQQLIQRLSDGLSYKAPRIRERKRCVQIVLSAEDRGDTQNILETFETFIESFGALEIPLMMIKPVLEKHFANLLNIQKAPTASYSVDNLFMETK